MLGLHQLNYFISIIDNNFSITKVADDIHITQSALSQFINNYEINTGNKLFVRGPNHRLEGLTPYGELLYHHAKIILTQWNQMETDLSQFKNSHKKRITFGMTASYIRFLFPDLFTNFNNEFPNIRMDLCDKPMPAIETDFFNGDLDFALLIGPIQTKKKRIKLTKIGEDELCAFISKSHPLAPKETLTWEDLIPYQVISLPESFQTHQRIKNTKLKRKSSRPQQCGNI